MRRIPVSVWTIVIAMCALWGIVGYGVLPGARLHDFLSFYTGASLARDNHFSDLYNPALQLEREQRVLPKTRILPFNRPPFYALFLAPLALMPYRTAFAVWIAGQILLMGACWIWGWRKFGPDALVFAAMFMPGPLGIANAQDCVMMLALLIMAFELAERDKQLSSGVVLALMLFKFHLILLWPVALLVQRRWRMLAGFSLGAAAEAIVSLALGGLQGVVSYIQLLRLDENLTPTAQKMVSYQGLMASLDIGNPWAALAIESAVLAILIFAVRRAPLWKLFSVTATASLFFAPHVYMYDAALLLLPCLLTIFHAARPLSRIFATLLATPLPLGFALVDKPWTVVAAASMLAFIAILACETVPEPAPAPQAPAQAIRNTA